MLHSKDNKWVYLFLVVTTVCMFGFVFLNRKSARIPGYLHNYNKTYKDAVQVSINNAPYHPIAQLTNIVIIDAGFKLNETQKLHLFSSLKQMLQAYSTGSFDDYLNFLKPKGMSWTYASSVIKEAEKSGTISSNVTESEAIRILFDRYSNGTSYKNYFYGIVDDPQIITSAIGMENEFHNTNSPGVRILKTRYLMPFDSTYLLTNYITLGVDFRIHLIHVSPSDSDILQRYGTITYANIYLLIQPGKNAEIENACFPLVAQFYLDPESDRWIPSVVTRANVWKGLEYKERILF